MPKKVIFKHQRCFTKATCWLVVAATVLSTWVISAAQEPSPAAGLIALAKSGRVPKERLGNIVRNICDRGNAADLDYVFRLTLAEDALLPADRLLALEGLAEAATTRKVKPAGDLAPLAALAAPARFPPEHGQEQAFAVSLSAIRLAGLWNVAALAERLSHLALADDSPPAVREAALLALVEQGGPAARAASERLASPPRPLPQRLLGLSAWAALDAPAAAAQAADLFAALADATADELEPLVAAFLARRQGAEHLAAALQQHPPGPDVAKLLLRAVYAHGRSDGPLVAVLGKAAGVAADMKPPSEAELKQLVEDMLAKGDAARGEAVFRRADLGCFKCHSISKAGGEVGPDLSPVGTVSPPDYLLNSILVPDLAVKEQFATTTLLTVDGKILQGIVADKDERRIVLKDATGRLISVPVDDIEQRREGGSLMPKGLAALLTRAELIDLARFLWELGKPGPYAVRATETIQRWRVLWPLPPELAAPAGGAAVPDEEAFGRLVRERDAAQWRPAYARAAGVLPLDELPGNRPAAASSGGNAASALRFLYLQGEIDVTAAGPIELKLDGREGIVAWLDGRALPSGGSLAFEADVGRHKLNFRVDRAARKTPALRVELARPEDSAAQFTAVGGP